MNDSNHIFNHIFICINEEHPKYLNQLFRLKQVFCLFCFYKFEMVWKEKIKEKIKARNKPKDIEGGRSLVDHWQTLPGGI